MLAPHQSWAFSSVSNLSQFKQNSDLIGRKISLPLELFSVVESCLTIFGRKRRHKFHFCLFSNRKSQHSNSPAPLFARSLHGQDGCNKWWWLWSWSLWSISPLLLLCWTVLGNRRTILRLHARSDMPRSLFSLSWRRYAPAFLSRIKIYCRGKLMTVGEFKNKFNEVLLNRKDQG